MKMFKNIFKKLRGRDAELIVDGYDGQRNLKFKNNYSMMTIFKHFKEIGIPVEVVYKRKEWIKQLIRFYWFFLTIYLIYIVSFNKYQAPLSIYFVLVLILSIIDFKKSVITLDY